MKFDLLIDPPWWHKLADRLLVFVLGLILLFSVFPWMQSILGEGRVIALDPQERRQQLAAPVEGRLQEWFVTEGQFVRKGEPIVRLADNDPQILQRMARENDALEKRVESMELARKTAAINVKRQRELFEQGLSARKDYEKARMELAQLESEEAQALAELSRMGVRLSRQEQQMIVAPVDGVVVSVLKTSSAGVEYVRAGDPLAVIVPETSSRVVEIWVSGNDMPWVRVGDRVAVQFDGWPAVFFSGVPGVSVGTFFGKVHLIDALDDGEGRFRVLVKPNEENDWPQSLYLKQGVRARGWVLLGDVPLFYELWRKFNGFPPARLPSYQLNSQDSKAK